MRISPLARATIATYTCQHTRDLHSRDHAHNQLDSIAESSIHKTTNRLPELGAQLLCRKTEQGRQRYDRQEVYDEDRGRVDVQCS